MTKEEAMKLALEAYCKTLHPLWNAGISRTEAEGFFNAGFKAAEALAKQEQGEPDDEAMPRLTKEAIAKTKPAQKQEQGEPVAWIEHHKGGDNLVWDEPNKGTPLYTTPQQRTWVELTDEDIEDCYKQGGIGRAIQMFKEKNT